MGLEQVVLSLYSLDRNTLKEVRGSDTLYEKTVRAADSLSEAHDIYDFTYIVQTVMMHNNFKEMPDLLKFAINTKADYFWPTYLENAKYLPEIRMTKEDIRVYKNDVVPEMIRIINESNMEHNLKVTGANVLQRHYSNEFDDYIYHDEEYICDWLGRHMTFYPNGTVYPCPGHEYYTSEYETRMDYKSCSLNDITDFLGSVKEKKFDFCRFCPQGNFGDIQLR